MPRPKGLPKTGGRRPGTKNRRMINVPSDSTLNLLSLQRLEELATKVNIVIDRKRNREATYEELEEVFNRIVGVLDGKTTAYKLLNEDGTRVLLLRGVQLNRMILACIPFSLFGFIEVGRESICTEVDRILRSLRNSKGKMPNYRPWQEIRMLRDREEPDTVTEVQS